MRQTLHILTRQYESPFGTLQLGSFGDKLCLCDWLVEKHHHRVCSRLTRILGAELVEGSSDVMEEAASQLDAYFCGERREFSVPLLFAGTDFQKKVWNELLHIPYGETLSYARMARHIGKPQAIRAVAGANGANALSIFAPCHRVIGSDHSLTGYAGGVDTKRRLLELEGVIMCN